MTKDIDQIDRSLLRELQRDASQSQRELADRVGLSQNTVWRRLKSFEDDGIIERWSVRLNRNKVGASLAVFTMIRTRSHSGEWLRDFRKRVVAIPEIVGFYRISGDFDYILKVVVADIAEYDRVYQQLIERTDLETVTSYFTMEAIFDERPLAL
ncbi:Lrp/AsnC family transcriptional regulator [Paracoccus suum]|uniref:Lrp/AsnC family transcriptional regulator n=1 Tax=Paracoccus suum TaxID=2259340 RepID=A0A344PP97_9RHOB|nr:Lrp/AsnC family transcriptional regulator [Paracoccus suum]AXC51202.1 Lrp/AsnC family transcriptional regulator [Paracoccus suum]